MDKENSLNRKELSTGILEHEREKNIVSKNMEQYKRLFLPESSKLSF